MKGISTVVATILMLVITIALAGTAMMYMRGRVEIQGIQVMDASCSSTGNVSFVIRNIGTQNISTITCTQTAPAGDTCTWTVNPGTIQPGNSSTFMEICTGTGGRTCVYKLMPSAGVTVDANSYCS